MTVVVDASAVLALLVDRGPAGTWASGVVELHRLAAPHLMPVEVASALRRRVARRLLDPDDAERAHVRLLQLPVELFPYEPAGSRVWALRENVTTYDGWYVALAEALDVSLVTLDRRLAQAPGPTCRILTPPVEG